MGLWAGLWPYVFGFRAPFDIWQAAAVRRGEARIRLSYTGKLQRQITEKRPILTRGAVSF